MKKFLKCLSLICLALIMVCPLALVGCDKNYTISISIQGGGMGEVLMTNVDGLSVVGKSAVKKGETFKYFVKPENGFEIGEIKVDGEVKTGYDKSGAYFEFENIGSDHTVVVTFVVAVKYQVTFKCLTEEGGSEYEVYLSPITVAFEAELNLNEAVFTGANSEVKWFIRGANSQRKYLYNNSSVSTDPVPESYQTKSNRLTIRTDWEIYCDLTAEQLTSLGVTLGINA